MDLRIGRVQDHVDFRILKKFHQRKHMGDAVRRQAFGTFSVQVAQGINFHVAETVHDVGNIISCTDVPASNHTYFKYILHFLSLLPPLRFPGVFENEFPPIFKYALSCSLYAVFHHAVISFSVHSRKAPDPSRNPAQQPHIPRLFPYMPPLRKASRYFPVPPRQNACLPVRSFQYRARWHNP